MTERARAEATLDAGEELRFRPSDAAESLARRWPLDPGRFQRGGPRGEHLASGTGSSVEFHDRRAFAPGDDPRRVDWRAWARTDELTVLVNRAEVRPRIEVLLDASRSMAVEPEKAQTALDLAAFLLAAAEAGGARAHGLAAGEEVTPLDPAALARRGLAFDGALPLSESAGSLRARLAPGGLRFVVSDFLFPHDPDVLLRSLASGAARLVVIQRLGAGDVEPPPEGTFRLVDAESGAVLERVVDEAAREAYRGRLERLVEGLAEAARRVGATFVSGGGEANEDLEAFVRRHLAPLGLFGS